MRLDVMRIYVQRAMGRLLPRQGSKLPPKFIPQFTDLSFRPSSKRKRAATEGKVLNAAKAHPRNYSRQFKKRSEALAQGPARNGYESARAFAVRVSRRRC